MKLVLDEQIFSGLEWFKVILSDLKPGHVIKIKKACH